jgi:hypothetical protein
VYGRTPNGIVRKQRFDERVRELRTIMSEEFGLDITEDDCHRLARALINVFKALSVQGDRQRNEQAIK